MKTIGLIGGMSWESTAHYYQLLNKRVNQRLGGHHSVRLLMYSVDFDDLARLQAAGKWDEATAMMVDAAVRLERAGADFLLIGTNTMHISAPAIEEAVAVPLLHIADAAGERIKAAGIRRVGLLGTAFTMEKDFYKGRLREKFGIETMIPGAAQRKIVHNIIYDELVRGVLNPASKQAYREIIAELVSNGAEGIILGCTELMMIIEQSDSTVPLFDTTTLHSEAAVEYALQEAAAATK